MMRADPYSYVAQITMARQIDRIRLFWKYFADHAEALDATFNSQMQDMQADPVAVMAPLSDINEELMWEFGPAENGHHLCITAEWKNEIRPLARAIVELAPDLPRWTFTDARSGLEPDGFAANFASRFRTDCLLQQISPQPGETGKVDMIVTGAGDTQIIGDQALMAATMLLGEEVDRDWFGAVDVAPPKTKGFMGRILGGQSDTFDPAAFKEAFSEVVATLRGALPEKPLCQLPLEERQFSLIRVEPDPDRPFRPDLLTFLTTNVSYAKAAIAPRLFSSANFSRVGEWFLVLRIPHHGQGDAEGRGQIEDRIHGLLAQSQLGGVMAGGHGTETYYIDIGVTDVAAALSLLSERLAEMPWFSETSVHFPDAGLEHYVFPLSDKTLRAQ